MRWAIYQLFALQTPGANAVLDRYATEVAQRFPPVAYPTPTPDSQMHRGFAQEIRRAVPQQRSK